MFHLFWENEGREIKKLIEIIKVGNVDQLKEFLEENIKPDDVHQKERYDHDVFRAHSFIMCYAASVGSIKIAEYLISLDPKYIDVAMSNDLPTHLYLFKEFNDVSLNDGSNVLMVATSNNQNDFAKFLLEKGADLSFVDEESNNILHVAEYYKNEEIADLVREDVIKEYPDLIKAVYRRDFAEIKKQVEEGADIESKDSSNNTPLICAVIIDNLEIVEFLLSQGANIDAEGDFGAPIIFIAAAFSSGPVFKYLAENGADLNKPLVPYEGASEYDFQLPIAIAAATGNIPVLNIFIELGFDLNAVPVEGAETALISALKGNKVDAAALLLENGADPNAIALCEVERSIMLEPGVYEETTEIIKNHLH